MKQAAYSLPVGSGLMGSKEVEVLGRTELLSSEAEDCSSCVSSATGWPSKSPLPLDSAAGTSHSGTHPGMSSPTSPAAAVAQTQPSLAVLARHRQLHREKLSCFLPHPYLDIFSADQ